MIVVEETLPRAFHFSGINMMIQIPFPGYLEFLRTRAEATLNRFVFYSPGYLEFFAWTPLDSTIFMDFPDNPVFVITVFITN